MGLARQEAQRLNSEFIGTEHILLGIIQEGGGVAGVGALGVEEPHHHQGGVVDGMDAVVAAVGLVDAIGGACGSSTAGRTCRRP